MASLSERMGYLQALRVGFALLTLGSALLASEVVGATAFDLLLVTAGYITLSATTEFLRQWRGGRRLFLVGTMLLVDGAYLAWVMYQTGGTQSPLRFLVYLHLIGVTLLASYRTGLKIAMWHSLLFFVIFYAQAAEILKPTDAAIGLIPGSPEFNRVSVFNVMAFWFVALGTAAFSALNERELRRRKADLEDLSKMSAALKNEAEPETVAHILLEAVGASFGFKRGIVALNEGDDAHVLAYRGPGDISEPPAGIDKLIQDAFTEQHTILSAKPDENENPGIAALLPFARNIVVVPLVADAAPLGALILEHPARIGARIERRVVGMVEQFAAHGALALRNSLLMKEVQKLADTDALTGLANRRIFAQALDREISRASRNGDPVTLLMLDVDHFKKFNDTHGHQEGDEILRRVGAALKLGSRDFDLPARYGGEEFAVILPACSSRESLVVAGRLRDKLGEIDAIEPITASGGVATYPTHAQDAEGLIRAADEALYEAKRAGRDRLLRSRRHPRSAKSNGAA